MRWRRPIATGVWWCGWRRFRAGAWSSHPTVEQPRVQQVFVGDWDGDGRSEAAFLHRLQDIRKRTLIRYEPDGRGTTLGEFEVPDFPAWAATLERPGRPALLMGAVRTEGGTQVICHSLAPTQGLRVVARYPLVHREGEPIASFTGGEVAGRPAGRRGDAVARANPPARR